MIFLHIFLNDKNHKNVHKFFLDVKKPADIAGFFMPGTNTGCRPDGAAWITRFHSAYSGICSLNVYPTELNPTLDSPTDRETGAATGPRVAPARQ
ncbi:hypothetical protein EMIT0P258_10571 [Pseudomonas sp. IT-P258]